MPHSTRPLFYPLFYQKRVFYQNTVLAQLTPSAQHIQHTMHLPKHLRALFICVLSMGAFTMNSQARTIEPVTATYAFLVKDKVSGKGSATRTLSHDGNDWTYQVTGTAMLGSATAKQTSSFKIIDDKVKPQSASTAYKILGVGNLHKVSFANDKVVSSYKGKSITLNTTQPAFDELSLEVQIRQELLNGKFTGKYDLVKKDKIETTQFKQSGRAKITVPAGSYDTVRIDRVHDDKDRQTTFWLAPSLNYLPVKVIQNNDSTQMQMALSAVK